MHNRPSYQVGLTLFLLISSVFSVVVSEAGETSPAHLPTNILIQAEQNLVSARNLATTQSTNAIAAWQLGRACFAWGDLQTNRSVREKIFTEGVAACRRSVALDSNSAPAFYYLGMNLGKVADLKRNLSALGMVKEVERSFQRARALDEKFSFAGPLRNLGLLYLEAPGWPLSVGDKKLARKYLQRAVTVAGDCPENRLNLAEAGVEWKDRQLVTNELAALEKIWPQAKTNLIGPDWERDWLDWEKRRAALQRHATSK